MYLALNWHKDQIGGIYRNFFTDPDLRKGLGNFLSKNLQHLLIRYPGGKQTQAFTFDSQMASVDFIQPGYINFLEFAKEYNLRLIHQLPTTGWSDSAGRQNVKTGVKGALDIDQCDILAEKSLQYVQWVKKSGFDHLVDYWELGNEDWIDEEGRLNPEQYHQIVMRYLKILAPHISTSKILINAQLGNRGSSSDWGYDLLKLIKSSGLGGMIGGVTIHLYPYFIDKNFLDSNDFRYDEYAVSGRITQKFSSDYFRLSSLLDKLEFPASVKIHITEMAVDIPAPVRASDRWYTFGNNSKNMAAAIASYRCLGSVLTDHRFAGACYHCLMERYLVAKEDKNPTQWKDYTRVDDWGWGQLWFLSEQRRFVPTPLLEAWGLLAKVMKNTTAAVRLSDSFYLFEQRDGQVVLVMNYNPEPTSISFAVFNVNKMIRYGVQNIRARTLKKRSYGVPGDVQVIEHHETKNPAKFNRNPYSFVFLFGKDIAINGVPVNKEFRKTSIDFDRKLEFGEFGAKFINNQLVIFPAGVSIRNFPLTSIIGMTGKTEREIAFQIFGDDICDIKEWEFFSV